MMRMRKHINRLKHLNRELFIEQLQVSRLLRRSLEQLRQAAERSAINAPMQGTAADIIKRAMIGVHAWCRRADFCARVIMQVHDELVLEVPDGELSLVQEGLHQLMTGVATLNVPLVVDVGMGSTWDEAH